MLIGGSQKAQIETDAKKWLVIKNPQFLHSLPVPLCLVLQWASKVSYFSIYPNCLLYSKALFMTTRSLKTYNFDAH